MTIEMSHSLFINICRTNVAYLRKNFIAIEKVEELLDEFYLL